MTRDILDPDFFRFSLQNPPDSVVIAYERLEQIEQGLEHMRAQLEFRYSDEFESDDHYYEWKARAISAYGYTRREVKFLERWITSQELLASVLIPNKTPSPISGIFSVIEKVIAQLRSEYQVVYTDRLEPPDLVSARKRKTYLDLLVQKYKGVAQGLLILLEICHVDKTERGRLLEKLMLSVAEVEKENQVLRRFLRKKHSGVVETLISALTRCLKEGFVLTLEESNSLNEILEERRLDKDE